MAALRRRQKGRFLLNSRISFHRAAWLRLVALSFLLGLALLAGSLLNLGTAQAQSVNAAITCPKITGFTPTSGSIGSSVTITGCGFTGATKVTFKGISASFVVNSDTQITATVPSGAASGVIAVTTASGTIVKSSSQFIVLPPPPAVTPSPTVGPPTSTVSVSGSNFGSYEAVDIYFDTTDEALAATNGQGAFSGISIQVPASAVPGTHWITAVGRHSGLSAQAAFTVQTNWAEFGDIARHTHTNHDENVLSPTNVGDLDVDWSATTGGSFNESSPEVVNGVVYIGSEDGSLYVFNAQTGAQLWSAATGSSIGSSPAVANGVVYVGSDDDSLYAFNVQTGAKLWSAATGSSITSSPAVANGVVYVGSDDDSLYAFNAQTGAKLWSAATGNSITSSPAVANGVVYVGSDDGSLYAFNTQTGAQLWSATTEGLISSSPAVANGMVYISSYNGSLYAYSLSPNDQLKPPARPSAAGLHPNLKLRPQS
jgi:outer membrane protein assembly factor BamB